jgi:hypothetical protein
MMNPTSDYYLKSLIRLDRWVTDHEYKGFEYYDGLTSWLRPLTFGNWLAERILVQIFKRTAFNIRPFFGVKPLHSTKGMGFFAKGYLRLWRAVNDDIYREKAINCLDWLIKNHSTGYSGYCWGNSTDHASGGFQLPKDTPTVVWSGLIGHAFLDAYEILKDDKYLEIAKSICDFITKDLQRTEFDDSFCFSYVPFKKALCHNANMIGASLLARTYSFTDEDALLALSRRAMKFTCDCQLENGAWYYAQTDHQRWIDNWHTGYNLDSLKYYNECSGDDSFTENLSKGYAFFKEHFFCDTGKPKYYHDRLRWADIQSAAQAIDTFCFFSRYDHEALDMAQKVAKWTIANMQDKTGYFYYRDIGWKNVKIPMIHWGQATMLSALGHLFFKLKTG